MASDPAQDPAIYALSGVTAVEQAGTLYFLRDCQPDKRVQTASPYDFRPDGPAFGSPLGGLPFPDDNVYHATSTGTKRARSVLMRTSDYMNAYATLDKFNLTDPPSGFYGRPPFQNAKIGPLNASSHGPHAELWPYNGRWTDAEEASVT